MEQKESVQRRRPVFWVLALLIIGYFLFRAGALFLGEGADIPGIKWTPYKEIVSSGMAEKKPVFLYFYSRWCGWCRRFERSVLGSPEVGSLLSQDFISSRINIFHPLSEKATSSFNVTGVPTVVFLDCRGNRIEVFPGYLGKNDFLKLLKEIYYTQKGRSC